MQNETQVNELRKPSNTITIFDYADIDWGDRGNVALMEQVQALQNKAACVILNLPPRTSATEARVKLGWKLLSRLAC